ncbi:MAG: hypothetical protein ACAF42_15905 [Limnothrix sp. BL-A-16]|jgi:hypothetical protein
MEIIRLQLQLTVCNHPLIDPIELKRCRVILQCHCAQSTHLAYDP